MKNNGCLFGTSSQLRKDRIEFSDILIAEKREKTQVTAEVSAGDQD
jgi:hypothetical protein